MKREIKKIENCKLEVTVNCDATVWADAQKKAFKELAKKVEIKGFRKGAAPEQMVKGRISDGEIFNQAINYTLQPMYEDVLNNESIKPFIQPNVNVTKVTKDELEVVFTIVTEPEVKLGAYKGLHADKDAVDVKDEDIDAEIKKMQEQNAQLVVVEREAKLGDTVTIDFEGFVDGTPFEGGKAENYGLELGSGQFIPGFEDQLVGTKAGDSKDVNVKFPENYVENLKGKDATFKCKVHEVKEKNIPEVNEDLVADLNIKDVKTVEELKNHVKNDLTAKATQASENKYYQDIVKQIRENSEIEIAKEIIDNKVTAMKNNLTQRLEQQGLTLDQYLQITGSKMEDIEAQMAKEADVNVRSFLSLDAVARAEQIAVTEADVDFEISKIADQYKMEVEKVKEIFKPNMEQFVSNIRNERVRKFILENNN